jgi:chromosome segregation ATPase
MSNQTPNIYKFPKLVEKEFHQLMTTKESFSKNLLSADRHKLETLYDQLQNAWDLNNTHILNDRLQMKYLEVRQTQRIMNQDWTHYEKSIEKELQKDLKAKLKTLEDRTKDLEIKKEISIDIIRAWKDDINKKNLILNEKKENLEKKKQMLTMGSEERLEMKKIMEIQLNEEDEKIKELQKSYEDLLDRISGIRRDQEQLPDKFDKLTGRETKEIEKLVREEEGLSEEFGRKEEAIPGEFKSEESAAQRDFEEERERTNEIIMSKNSSGNTPLHNRIRRLLASRESLDDLEQALSNNKRNRTAWECFKSGAYESWVE